ncbi:MAG: glycosyltransferase family 4 protein [Bacteroidia bacterium]
MRILQLINRFPWPLKDGGALGYYNFLKGYHDAGCELTAAILNTSKHHIEFDALPTEVKNLADYHLVDIDNRIKPIDALKNLLFTSDSYHVVRFISSDFNELLVELLKEKEFDVVVFESIFMAPYLSTVRKYSKAKCVLRAHNVEFEIWQSLAEIESNPIKKWYLQILSKRLKSYELAQLNSFDGLSCVTEKDALAFQSFGYSKTWHVAPTGMDISRLQPNYAHLEQASILHLGSMDWMPNQEALKWFIKEVWPTLKSNYPQLKFYAAGRNMPDEFHQFAGNGIEILGEVENAIELMNSKSIMVVPLFSGSGIRVKILEGLALGKCMVSTQLGYTGIEVTPGKNIFRAETASEFIEQISNILENPELIKESGFAARKLVESKYESSKVITDLLSYYEDIKI